MAVTNDIYQRIVRLTLYYTMEEQDVERVTNEINTFFKSIAAS